MSDASQNDSSSFAAQLIDLIENSKIFSNIDRVDCEALLPRLERVSLAQGDALFEQGDQPDCVYILVDGQLFAVLLTAEGKHKIVGTVEKGETVGELGVLSNQPRSLTIRAAIDSRLLKLPRDEFEKFSKLHPTFISQVIDLIISRSQETLKLLSQKKLYKHVAIIKGNGKAPLDKFIEMLTANLDPAAPIVFIPKAEEGAQLNQIIEQSELENKTVIFILDESNLPGLQPKLNHIGGIFVVVDGDVPSPFSEFALDLLSRNKTPFTSQYELALIHDDNVVMPSGTMYWLNEARFTLHHHLHCNNHTDYQRIIRFMTGKAIGLVCGGGGNKGWVEVGVLKAMLEANLPIDAVGGTSVGALITASYAMSRNYDETLKNFTTLVEAASHPFMLNKLTWPIISLISAKNQTEALMKIFKNIQIEDLWLPFFSIASNLSTGKEAVHRQGTLWEKLRASASIPGIASPMVMDGELYYDGGLLNNLPVDHMRHLLGEESRIVAVSLSGTSATPKFYNFPAILPFWLGLIKTLKLGYKQYKFPPFFHTFMQSLTVGSASKEKANQLISDILVCPNLSKYRTLQLGTKQIDTLIDIGYQDMQEHIQTSKLFT